LAVGVIILIQKVDEETADNGTVFEAVVGGGGGVIPVGKGYAVGGLVDHVDDALTDHVEVFSVAVDAGRPHEPVDLGVIRAAV